MQYLRNKKNMYFVSIFWEITTMQKKQQQQQLVNFDYQNVSSLFNLIIYNLGNYKNFFDKMSHRFNKLVFSSKQCVIWSSLSFAKMSVVYHSRPLWHGLA